MATPAFLKEVDHCDACYATTTMAPTTAMAPTKSMASTTTMASPTTIGSPTTMGSTVAGPSTSTVADPCADCDCGDSASQQHILSIAALAGAVLVSFVF